MPLLTRFSQHQQHSKILIHSPFRSHFHLTHPYPKRISRAPSFSKTPSFKHCPSVNHPSTATPSKMCFYDANEMSCKCWKWGHFRQHCAKEYRTGETCGMKLVMNRYQLPEKCKICTKIDTKERAIRKEEERIRRWSKEHGSSRKASIAKAEQDIYNYQMDIQKLSYDRDVKRGTLN